MTGRHDSAGARWRQPGRGRRLLYVLLHPGVILALGLLTTLAGVYVARNFVLNDGREQFKSQVAYIALAINNRVATYQQILMGGAALFHASNVVSREEWASYVTEIRINDQLPGVQAIGFAQRIVQSERAQHVERVRREDANPAYDIRPPGERPEYVVITYNEPYVGRNRNVVGFDMFAEPTRRAAMERARDGGAPALSGKVVLAGEAQQDRPAGFVFYVPIYRTDMPKTAVQQRRQSIRGYIFSPFRMHELMSGVVSSQERFVHIRVYDGPTAESDALVYDSATTVGGRPSGGDPLFAETRTLEVAGRTWTLAAVAMPEFAELIDWHVPYIVLGAGIVISILLFAATRWLAAVRHSEARFRDYATLGSDWYWEQDADLRFTYVSPRYFQVTGTDPKDILGRTRHEVFGRPHRSLLTAEVWDRHLKTLAAREPFRGLELPVRTAEGELRYLMTSGVPVFDDAGRFAGYRGIGRDVTEERKREFDLLDTMEVAEAANRSKSAFLAHMSHELRTPLNAVLGFSEIIRDQHFGKTGSAKYIEYAGDIYDSGRHLLALVNDVLDMSRIEAGRYELVEEHVDLHALIDSSIAMVAPRAGDSRIQLRSRLEDDLPPLRCDSRSIKQVALNLLSNAVKFTESGGTVTVSGNLAADGALELRVADTGVGIPVDHIERVFEPFHQVDDAMRRRSGGSGLGLAIPRSLVVLHGGTIELESEVGVGTTAIVRFPAERVVRH